MSLLDPFGLQWKITSVDPEVTLKLAGQFRPTGGVELQAPANITSTATAGSDVPMVQWVHGGAPGLRFASSYVADNFLEDMQPQIDMLARLNKRDATLGRAPRVAFTWGTVAIEGFATVDYRITGFWPISGRPKSVVFTVTIQGAEPPDEGGRDSGETQHLILGAGETFELLGLRFYADPLRGEMIRRRNPEIATAEVAGARVKVLERTHPDVRGKVRPTAPSFLDRTGQGKTWMPVVTELAEDRGATTVGLPWDLQPEVLAGEV